MCVSFPSASQTLSFIVSQKFLPLLTRIKFESIERITIFRITREAVKVKGDLNGKDFRESGTVKNILEHLVKLKDWKNFKNRRNFNSLFYFQKIRISFSTIIYEIHENNFITYFFPVHIYIYVYPADRIFYRYIV